MSNNNKNQNDAFLFFYNQREVIKRPTKRPKKVLSESAMNMLNKKGDKFQTDLTNDESSSNQPISLAARLAEMTSNNSVTSMHSSNQSRTNHRGTVYTDTRLQALRFLTEDIIKELEEKLNQFSASVAKPVLPAPIIYEWHSDWSDLTDQCNYDNFPLWQTKNGRESTQKKPVETTDKPSKKDKQSGAMSRQEKQDDLASQLGGNDSMMEISRKDSTSTRKSIQINNPAKIVRQSSKLSMISEKSADQKSGRNQNRRTSLNKNMSPVGGVTRNRYDPQARSMHNASQNSGCQVVYYLSNKSYREKGWTVMDLDREEEIIDVERQILGYLKTSLKSIDEVRRFNEKYSLTKPCKIRFYGDYKKEQIEKYKTPVIRPKKSQFAMSIMRNEIPKPLDLNFMLEVLSNPNLSGLALGQSLNLISKTLTFNLGPILSPTGPNQLENKNASSAIKIPRPPPMLNTQTNDGTTCIYYTNGQVAIVLANVYGYFIENSGSSLNNPTSNGESSFSKTPLNQNNLTSVNSSYSSNSGAGTGGPTLACQNIKNSYTTVIYDVAKKPPKSASVTINTNQTRLESFSTTEDLIETAKKSTLSAKLKTPQVSQEQRMLAVISPLGYCVVYRNNGNPKFVCTEYGGCLCNRNGSVSFQWRWDDLRYTEYERFKNELLVDLNEYIRLEYKNPSSIKLKYSCDKDIMEFDLGCPKEYQNRLHDLLNRTVSEFPLKSKLSQLKLIPNAKAQTLIAYKQYHNQQQQQYSQGIQKSSIFLGQMGSSKDLQEPSKIDKLLDTTVSYKDVPVMKDLLLVQKKIRSLLEDWLTHCRNSLGIMEPDMYILPDIQNKHKVTRLNENHSDFDKIVFHRRKSKSAENLTIFNRLNLNSSLTLSSMESGRTQSYKKNYLINSHDLNSVTARLLLDEKRSKSAFITRKSGKSVKQHAEFLARIKEFKAQMNLNTNTANQQLKAVNTSTNPNQFLNAKNSSRFNQLNSITKSAIWPNAELNKVKASNLNRVLSSSIYTPRIFSFKNPKNDANADLTSRSTRFFTNDDLNLMCPVSLHQKLAFERFDSDCKCKKQNVPYINDVEFDYFLRLVPIDQLVVIVITDRQISPSNPELIVSELFESLNRNRLQPCKESIKDDYRYLFYDIRTAADNSDHTQPLLVVRHNVGPGMVLIYKNSKLLFCDNIFNGYGYSQQDFMKQLQKSREDAKLGKYLPYNFLFNHPVGKHGRRTPWGGQIAGMDDVDENYSSQNVSNTNEYGSSEELNEGTKINNLNITNKSISLSNLIVPKLMINSNKNTSQINLPKINKTTLQV